MKEAAEFVNDWRLTVEARSHLCFYCGIPTVMMKKNAHCARRRTKEHVVPKERFNSEVVFTCNVVFACQECNTCRSSFTIEEFRNTPYWRSKRRPFFCEEILGRACPSEYGSSRAYHERLEGQQHRKMKEELFRSRTPQENFFIALRGYAIKNFPQYSDHELKRIVEGFFALMEERQTPFRKLHGSFFHRMKSYSALTPEIIYQTYFHFNG
jgi:hypothetical protein